MHQNIFNKPKKVYMSLLGLVTATLIGVLLLNSQDCFSQQSEISSQENEQSQKKVPIRIPSNDSKLNQYLSPGLVDSLPETSNGTEAYTRKEPMLDEAIHGTKVNQKETAVPPGEPEKRAISETESEKKEPEPPKKRVKGYAFIKAAISPMDYELNERFWGWRPNDILNFTDNVNNLQRGILEVTRRTVVLLAHRIARTGSNDIIDENLENAMNWLMIKAEQYWFPSPESKYNQAIDELNTYLDRLERGRATFFIRTDNLIPLLETYEDLLGGCDQSLTSKEDDDGPITSSRADNYFFYAQGVSKALGTIFRGIRKDFYVTLESVHGVEILDQAIEACDIATNIKPWLVTEGSLSSIFANHRANIGQPINRIRFYMNVLIRTLKGY
ncbi:MAG: hypothetical protein OMM_03678 [Candidatus Magnetoglobus multicellularis str. Araruama]|uniref:DUF2333 family protein n=1 Tax=Candidatus Magnetoglobus multicellularis str. Araruama TaxID=890399 RepID=A0A1V1P504_9BACT|nr:MAG: hypothetical protein OMM_03678 [Candidatus Magnetoglobus multicellularis str. Araruama]